MKCQHIKSDGEKCGSYAMTNSDYCWVHSPYVPEEIKKAAFVKGGEVHFMREENGLRPIALSSPQDIVALLIDTISRLRAGMIRVRTGTAIGYLSYILLGAFELANFEQRVKASMKNSL